METLTVLVEPELTSLGKLEDQERTEILSMVAEQVTPIPMLPYGVIPQLKSVRFQ